MQLCKDCVEGAEGVLWGRELEKSGVQDLYLR